MVLRIENNIQTTMNFEEKEILVKEVKNEERR